MESFAMMLDLQRYIGKTITIFTTSGGISGSGFTGVLACADERVVKLITRIGAPPACPVGSTCTGFYGEGFGREGFYGREGFGREGFYGREGFGRGGCGCGGRCGCGGGGYLSNFLGSVTEIPIHSIASFTHNAI